MLDTYLIIIATNIGHNWWSIPNHSLSLEIIKLLRWYDVAFTKDHNGIQFEYVLEKRCFNSVLQISEQLRIMHGHNSWRKINNINMILPKD